MTTTQRRDDTTQSRNTRSTTAKSTLGSHSRRGFLRVSAGGAFAAFWALEGCRQNPEIETQDPDAVGDTLTTEISTPSVDEATKEAVSPSRPALRIAFAGVPLQFDPAVVSANAAIQVAFTIYEGLVWVDQDLTLRPALATAWEASPDLLSWTFTLRQDLLFHHGTPFTAQDVVYTFERLLDPAVGSPMRSLLSFVEGVEPINDGTPSGAVRFTLTSANADLPLLCGTPQALIVSQEYDTQLLARAPSGTGPFQVDELIPGQAVTLVRNEAHWAVDEYLLQKIHYLFIPQFEARAAALRTSEIDLLPDISIGEANLLRDADEITIAESPSGAYQTVVMQATEAPFDDIRVRQALKLCIDQAVAQEALLGGQGEIGHNHPVASISPFHADLTAPQRNIEQAKQLLLEAGYPNGIKLDLITSDLDPGMVQLAYLVQEMAAPAGFDIVPTEVPGDVYWTTYWTQVPFHIGSWNFRPSIDETIAIAFHSQSLWNESRWFNAELDRLVESARSEPEHEQRKALYQQAQQLIMEDGAVIIPVFRPVLTAVQTRVVNFRPHPAGWINLRGIEIVEKEK